MFCKINGELVYLWRAVDQSGEVLDVLVQKRRDAKAAKRFFRKLLKEAWIDGQLAAQWPATMCATYVGTETLTQWERKTLEEKWGYYPNPPREII